MSRRSPTQPKPRSVLLVDDNRHGSVARQTVLTEHGYAATTTSNGEEALEAFAAQRYDIVVTDYRMPRMNGVELIKQIRTESNVPIILLSGYASQVGLDEKSTGADAVIAKGANEVSHLLRAISRLLSRGDAKKPMGSQEAIKKTRSASA
jgi:two-component system, NtrC family, response regulator HydG